MRTVRYLDTRIMLDVTDGPITINEARLIAENLINTLMNKQEADCHGASSENWAMSYRLSTVQFKDGEPIFNMDEAMDHLDRIHPHVYQPPMPKSQAPEPYRPWNLAEILVPGIRMMNDTIIRK